MRAILLAMLLLFVLVACSTAGPNAAQNQTNLTQNASAPGTPGGMCGGIAGIPCPSGYSCRLDGTYPDAVGVCMRDESATLRVDYCDQDADCVRQASCCGCGDGTWVNRMFYNESLCPVGTPRCKCAMRERYPLCENHHCTSRAAR